MAVLDVTGIESIGGIKVSTVVDCVAVMKVVLATNVLVFTVSETNVGFNLPVATLTVAAIS